ncbi:hypothetical protein U1Q18_046946 [Sarracenia purpurea var. burkii]
MVTLLSVGHAAQPHVARRGILGGAKVANGMFLHSSGFSELNGGSVCMSKSVVDRATDHQLIERILLP